MLKNIFNSIAKDFIIYIFYGTLIITAVLSMVVIVIVCGAMFSFILGEVGFFIGIFVAIALLVSIWNTLGKYSEDIDKYLEDVLSSFLKKIKLD